MNNEPIDTSAQGREKIKNENDSNTFRAVNRPKTFFNISKKNIVRKYRGNLNLNFQNYDTLWIVKILSLSSGVLKVYNINSKDVFNKLATVSENEVIKETTGFDTVRRILKLTKEQFKTILKLKESLIVQQYLKIK